MMGVDADMVAGLRLQTCELIDLGLVCAQSRHALLVESKGEINSRIENV